MMMHEYLNDMDFAARNLLPIIWGERNRVQELEVQILKLTRATEENYQRARALAVEAEDPDDVAMATGMYWQT
jgi:hypothetical protein